MARLYFVPYTGTLTNAGGNSDLLSVQPAVNKPCRLRGFILGQTSEAGDAAEESLRITAQVFPATFTVGTGGSLVTAARPPEDPTNGPTWGFTARANDTGVATTSGTAVSYGEWGWNVRSTPYDFHYPDARYCPMAINGQALIVRMESTPTDDITAVLGFWVEEEG